MMRALDDVNRVELHEAHLLYEAAEHCVRSRSRGVFEQTLRAHQKESRLFCFHNGKVHDVSGRPLYSRASAAL
jgi:cytochrome b involved in lipid metabolism